MCVPDRSSGEAGKTEPDFSLVPSDKTRWNGHKLKYRKSHLNIIKQFCGDLGFCLFVFLGRVIKHWNRLPREVVESPFQEISKPNWANPQVLPSVGCSAVVTH